MSILTAGAFVLFEKSPFYQVRAVCSRRAPAALSVPENILERRPAPDLDYPAAKQITELLVPSHPCIGPSFCAHSRLAGGCLLLRSGFENSVPSPEDFRTSWDQCD